MTSSRWFPASVGVAAFVLAFLFLTPWSCLDVGGVSSWERCSSAMGTPAFSVEDWGFDSDLDALIPVLTGSTIWIVTWWLSPSRRRADR